MRRNADRCVGSWVAVLVPQVHQSLFVLHCPAESTSAAKHTTRILMPCGWVRILVRFEVLQMFMVDLIEDEEQLYFSHSAFRAHFSLEGDGATLQ